MPLTDSPDCLFRPEDKAFRMLFSPTEDTIHSSFDDFFNKELYDIGHEDDDRASPPEDDLAYTHLTGVSGLKNSSLTNCKTSPEPWRKGLWCLNSDSTSELFVGKTRKLGHMVQNTISPSHLATRENLATRSSMSPSKTRTKTPNPSLKPATMDNAVHTHNSIRHQKLSPTPSYAYWVSPEKLSNGEMLRQGFENFHLQMPDNGMYLSSPCNEDQARDRIALRQANDQIVAHNATTAYPPQSPTRYHNRFNRMSKPNQNSLVPGSTEISAPLMSHNRSRSYIEQFHNAECIKRDDDDYDAPVWTTESLYSSDSSHQSQASHCSTDSYHFGQSTAAAEAWISPISGIVTDFSAHSNVPQIAAPTPQRFRHQILQQQQQPEMHHLYGGPSTIRYPSASNIGKAISYDPEETHYSELRSATPSYTMPIPSAPYPPLPPFPPGDYADASSFTTPRNRSPSNSRSPSPTASPSRRSVSRGPTQRSPTRSDYSHTRRKSIHKTGPMRETSHHESQRRTRSTSRAPRTPKTPKTPTTAGIAQLDFVNFTMKDSAKLMSDVAPSGSSKTRARREQEAKEKRKRLSEAAIQAIRNAGGDVRALEDAIFI